jgi:hypothetical protein
MLYNKNISYGRWLFNICLITQLVLLAPALKGQDLNRSVNKKQNGIYEIEFNDKKNVYLNSISATVNPMDGSVYLLENETGTLSLLTREGDYTVLDILTFDASDEYHFIERKHHENALLIWEVGLGQVYQYDLDAKVLEHVSTTDVSKIMYSHGAFLDVKNNIMAWGGYGFWEMRKLFLYYDTEKTEWLLESGDFEDYDEYSYFHDVWYDSTRQTATYLFNLVMGTGEVVYNTGIYDFKTKEWSSKRWFQFDADGIDNRRPRPLFIQNTYLSDAKRALHYFYGTYFMNSSDHEIYQLELPEFDRYRFYAGFYLEDLSEWLFITKDADNSTTNLNVIRFESDDLSFKKVSTLPYVVEDANNLWWGYLGIAISLLGLLFFVFVVYPRVAKKERGERIKLLKHEDRLQIQVHGEFIWVTDEYVKRVWEVLYDLKSRACDQITISEFDELVFFDNNSSPFRSRKRKTIIKTVNRHLNTLLLTTVVNNVDKRYKDIKVNLELIELA